MKERPILFSAPMVQAILAGRKTQTRRIVSKANSLLGSGTWPQDGLIRAFPQRDKSKLMLPGADDTSHRLWPRYELGDRLWVKETFADLGDYGIAYRADGETADHWKPSIFMHRAASRITLEVTSVCVERVQDISHVAALAEGVAYDVSKPDGALVPRFQALWKSINGPDSWAANPWVWVIEFRRIHP